MSGRLIPCEEARGLLDERLDGPLPAAREAGLSSHLAACRACRAAEASLSAVDGALRSLEAPDPGPAFSDRVVAALDRAPGGSAAPRVPASRRLLRGLVAAAGTASVALLGASLLPVQAAAAAVDRLVPGLPAPPLPEVLAGVAGLGGILPAWAAGLGALAAAAGAALPVAALRRSRRRP